MIGRDQSPGRPRINVTGQRIAPGASADGDFTYFVVTTNMTPSPAEHRREKRMRTRLRDGIIADRRVTLTCQIRDRSRLGARLHLDQDHPLPRSFTLTDAASNVRFSATLVWQRGQNAGVRLRTFDPR